MSERPAPRLIRTFGDAERAACEWMIYYGYEDARLTPTGPDGGVDVRGARAVAQVKSQTSTVARPAVQQLYGVAQHEGRDALFFSLGGYTADAISWGTQVGMALFTFDLQGEPRGVNGVARSIANSRAGATRAMVPTPPPPVPFGSRPPTQRYELAPALQRGGSRRDGASTFENMVWLLFCFPAPLVFWLAGLASANVEGLSPLAPRLTMIARYLVAPRGKAMQRSTMPPTRMRWYVTALWITGVVLAVGALAIAAIVFALTVVGIPLAHRCVRALKVIVEPTEWCPSEMLALPSPAPWS